MASPSRARRSRQVAVPHCASGWGLRVSVFATRFKNLIRNGALSDRISQQRWGMFLRLPEVKAARAGLAYKQVNPRNTSLDCSQCSHRKPKKDLPLGAGL